MKKKYYIRGIGVGVLITVIILSISFNVRTSDKNVIERAQELGMVFATESPESEPEASVEPIMDETNEPDQTEDNAEGSQTPMEEEPLHTQEAVPDSVPQGAEDEEPDKNNNVVMPVVTITITRGMLSNQVANLLENEGLVGDARKFNDFLEMNGYSRRIRIGKFRIPNGASFQEIASIIATRGN